MAPSVKTMLAEIRAQYEYAKAHKVEVHHKAPPAEFPNGNHKFTAQCSCGWHSTNRLTAAAAAQAAIHHVWKVTQETRPDSALNGVSLPRNVSGGMQDRSTG